MRNDIFKWFKTKVNLENKIILDAGSGGNSLPFLLVQKPKEIYAVSIDAEEVKKNKRLCKTIIRETHVIHEQADLTQKASLPENYFDVVFCDYFLAGVEGHTPFKIPDVIENFTKV